jgi:hypothetical protein
MKKASAFENAQKYSNESKIEASLQTTPKIIKTTKISPKETV